MKHIALITGAGSGIGQACAQVFSDQGFDLILMGRNIEKLKHTQSLLKAESKLLTCDLSSSASIESALKILKAETRLQVLVNNAGVFEKNHSLKSDLPLWRRMFETNLFGTVQLTEGLAAQLKAKSGSAVVNVASTLAHKSIPETSAYSASKAALVSWTKALAKELAPEVRVNCVCPGIIDTPIHPFHEMEALNKSELLNQMKALQPMNRVGVPMDVAHSVYFLASPQSPWTTGAVLDVDGGINLL